MYKGSLQGRAVAVKRLLQDFVTLAAREVNILQESDDHPNVWSDISSEGWASLDDTTATAGSLFTIISACSFEPREASEADISCVPGLDDISISIYSGLSTELVASRKHVRLVFCVRAVSSAAAVKLCKVLMQARLPINRTHMNCSAGMQ